MNFTKKKESDDILIEKCKEFKIYKSLFVIDEAHNIFDTNNVVLIWWLSYHRHLYHDIYLITQNLSLIHSKYKAFSEYFYKAKPTTLSLSGKTFKYDVYINSRMTMTARSHTEKLVKNDEVFALYHSGDTVSAKNILLKFYLFSFSMMLIFGLLVYYIFFSSSKSSEKNATATLPIQQLSTTTNIEINQPSLANIPDYTSLTFLSLKCNKHYCYNDYFKIDFEVINHFINSNQITIINTSKISSFLHTYNLYMPNDLFNFLQGGTNEKNNHDITSFSGIVGR